MTKAERASQLYAALYILNRLRAIVPLPKPQEEQIESMIRESEELQRRMDEKDKIEAERRIAEWKESEAALTIHIALAAVENTVVSREEQDAAVDSSRASTR